MPLLHVYEEVVSTADVDGGPAISLKDGTRILLPQAARKDVECLVIGDRVLLDLVEWRTPRELATVRAFRDIYPVLSFSMGHHCIIESPVLAK